LYTWGEGKFGRLGHSSESNCHVPRLVESLIGKKPHQVSCGGFHTAVVTEDGQLYTFGGGEHGQLGHNDRVNKLKPTLVQALEGVFISQITCGWSHSVALTSPDGRVYTWGNSDHGKLGHGSGRKVTVPQLVDKLNDYRVVRVASYNEHTATLVEPTIVAHHNSGDHTGSSSGSASMSGVFFGASANSTTAAALHSVPVSALYSQQFRSLVNDDEFSDVTFLVGENTEPVHAHRAILVQRCETFAAMFRSGMRESIEKTISIPTIPRKAFLLLLEYIYTDSVKVDLENAIDLYNAADLYHLERLRDMCLNVVRRNLSLYNSGPLLQQAADLHCHSLKDVCMKYVVENFDAVSKSDGIRQVSHDLLLEILSKR
jgi:RCC1 and BTB domain-containing protein